MTLINISILPWRSGRMKRNLSIFTHLLKYGEFSKGIYVNTTRMLSSDRFSLPAIDTTASYSVEGTPVVVLQPRSALPFLYRFKRSAQLSAALLTRKIQQFIGNEPYCLWINAITPVECALAEALTPGARHVVLDCSDDMPTLEDPRMYEDAKLRLARVLRIANDVFCVNEHVATTFDHPSKHLFRNCTNFANLRVSKPDFRLEPWIPKAREAVYVGFVGTLSHGRVDSDLLGYLFRRFPNYQFLFVGWVSDVLKPLLASYPNAHHVQEVPNHLLGTVIRTFDVAIVPHLDNQCTQGNDLLKVLDCNACEVPVVATPVSGVNPSDYVVSIASSHEQFGDAVQFCVEGRHGLDLLRGARLAQERSWDYQVPRLLPLINIGRRADRGNLEPKAGDKSELDAPVRM